MHASPELLLLNQADSSACPRQTKQTDRNNDTYDYKKPTEKRYRETNNSNCKDYQCDNSNNQPDKSHNQFYHRGFHDLVFNDTVP